MVLFTDVVIAQDLRPTTIRANKVLSEPGLLSSPAQHLQHDSTPRRRTQETKAASHSKALAKSTPATSSTKAGVVLLRLLLCLLGGVGDIGGGTQMRHAEGDIGDVEVTDTTKSSNAVHHSKVLQPALLQCRAFEGTMAHESTYQYPNLPNSLTSH
ncbi:hypothetical protein BDQ17DRAFT_1414458 [Cyathus striatus]|nr:hypothetical protein BDQ17DRAFT_1414458 [Cyathus striatus]